MKVSRSILLLIAIFVVFLSCQKELWFDGISSGTLDCPPLNLHGIFKKDTLLTNTNFVDVRVNVSIPGKFEIQSDTINGYSFNNTGDVILGINTIRLFASGKPIAAGTDRFTIKYGTSNCSFDITVEAPGPAVFTLEDTGGECTGAVAGGTYTAGTSLSPGNTLTINVDVTTPGFYLINTGSTNGIQFTGNGIFTTTGIQTVILAGTGTPIVDGIFTITVSNIVSACTFNIIVQSLYTGTAVFSFIGSPNDCINYAINGTYAIGMPMTIANKVSLDVNVVVPGSYIVTTNSADGITFSTSGTFLNAGIQTIVLPAIGIPLNTGLWAFIPNTGVNSSCSFSLTVQPPLPPAVFTLAGSPGACTPGTVYGNYTVSVPLNPSNTVAIQVDVITAGPYTFSTNTNNGIKFSASGVFSLTGLQTITMRGSGIPLATGSTVLTPQYATSGCTFSVNVQ